MAVIVIIVLVDAQLLPHLPDIGRVNFEAILILDILFNIVIVIDNTRIGLQVSGIHGDTQIVADLFPT